MERQRPQSERHKRSTKAAAIIGALVTTVLVACSTEANTTNPSIKTCDFWGAVPVRTKQGEKPITDTAAIVESARQNIRLLHYRATNNGNEIALPGGEIDDITSTPDKLNLHLDGDHKVRFAIAEGEPTSVKLGTLVCSQDDGMYTNKVYTTLDKFVDVTKGLGSPTPSPSAS